MQWQYPEHRGSRRCSQRGLAVKDRAEMGYKNAICWGKYPPVMWYVRAQFEDMYCQILLWSSPWSSKGQAWCLAPPPKSDLMCPEAPILPFSWPA